ncbi:Uncharacterized protein F54H12.2 [Stylophora pistillata]|uniref:Uncharacterized protein F54H12.2 n=1 Tax=Stylophora pistillata TaxID=50429 RepID=A0A2B4SXN9_STYPI|nr:Uncharacterized protein F54H12.2 [Stylophora pistillata]
METPRKKPSKGVKSRRNHPYANDVPLHFKKESAEKHPDGKVMIDGIPQVAQEPKSKKNWSKKKNSKNLTLDIPPPSQTVEEWKEFWKQRVEACKAQDEPPPPPPPVQVEVVEEGEIPEAGAEQNPSLNLLRVPPVYLSTVKSRFTKVSPQTSSITPIEVYVPKQTEFIDLTKSFVELDLAFKTTDDGNLTLGADNNGHILPPVNNIAHSLFKQVNVKLNGTLITEQVDMYHLKTYIQTLLNFDRADGETILGPAGWRNDIDSPEMSTANSVTTGNGAKDALSANHKASTKTQKADARSYYVGGNHRVLRMVPFVDIFQKGKWLATRTEMDLKFYLNLYPSNPSVYDNAMSLITKTPAKYLIIRTEMRQFPLDNGATSKEIINPFNGKIPQRIVMGILAPTVFNGQYDKDPFVFGQFGVEWVKQIWNGKEYPYETMQLNTRNGRLDLEGDWDVGLSSISLPHESLLIPYLKRLSNGSAMLKTWGVVFRKRGNSGALTELSTTVDYGDVKHRRMETVYDLLQALFEAEYVKFLNQLQNYDSLYEGEHPLQFDVMYDEANESITISAEKVAESEFRSFRVFRENANFHLRKDLCLLFDWIKDITYKVKGIYINGPNLLLGKRGTKFTETRNPSDSSYNVYRYGIGCSNMKGSDDGMVDSELFYLHEFTHTFINLKKSTYHNGMAPRTLYLYSSLCAPVIMGNKTTDAHVSVSSSIERELLLRTETRSLHCLAQSTHRRGGNATQRIGKQKSGAIY